MAEEITQICKEAAANHLPKKEITKKPWITKETIEAIEKRKKQQNRKTVIAQLNTERHKTYEATFKEGQKGLSSSETV